MTINNALFELADLMAQARSFTESAFRLGFEEGITVMSPPRKKDLSSWTLYYNATINPCAQIVNNLYPIVEQCEAINADLLKSLRLKIVRRMATLKSEFDTSFERLLEKLNTLTGEILLKCLGDNPNNTEKKKVNRYFIELQLEVTEKVQDLRKFQENLNSRCTKIHIKIGYADLSGPLVFQGPTTVAAIPRNHKFAPIQNFLPS